jgi:2-alkenal reductase
LIGTSKNLSVGQAAYAIGNSFGLTRTLTTGIVSAVERHLPTA